MTGYCVSISVRFKRLVCRLRCLFVGYVDGGEETQAVGEARSLRQFLEMLATAGVTHLPAVKLPVELPRAQRLSNAATQSSHSPSAKVSPLKNAVDHGGAGSLTAPVSRTVTKPALMETVSTLLQRDFTTVEQKAAGLCELAGIVAACRRCSELAETRRQTVFGTGNPDARIMFIGEAPGADEDRVGEPFVGAAGQLLTKIIQAMGLTRDEIYICNILRCRPPGNRNPHPQEATNCREFLDGQIQIVNPEYIVCWGTVAAQNLLNDTRPVGKLRGQFFQHGRAKVLCTYHPSYLLRVESAKKQVWEDMKLFLKQIEDDADQSLSG